MFLPHLKLNQTRTASALSEPEPQPLATVAAVHAIEQRSASGPQPVTLSTGRVIVPDVRNSVVTHWNVADDADAEMTDAEYNEFCQIQADRRKAKQNADFLTFVDKRERAKAEWLRQHTTPSAGFLEPAGTPAVEPVPVRPSALSTAAADGFRPTEYKSDGTGNDERCSLWYKQTGRGLWRFYVYTDERDAFSVVGPYYKTKSELLGDLERYALEYGFPAIPRSGFLAEPDALPIATLSTGYFRAGLRGTARFQEMRTVFLGAIGHEVKTQIPEYVVALIGGGKRDFCQAGRDFEFIAADRPSGYQIQCGHIERHDTKRGTDENVVTVLSGEHGVFHVRQSMRNPTATRNLIDETFVDIADARKCYDDATR